MQSHVLYYYIFFLYNFFVFCLVSQASSILSTDASQIQTTAKNHHSSDLACSLRCFFFVVKLCRAFSFLPFPDVDVMLWQIGPMQPLIITPAFLCLFKKLLHFTSRRQSDAVDLARIPHLVLSWQYNIMRLAPPSTPTQTPFF